MGTQGHGRSLPFSRALKTNRRWPWPARFRIRNPLRPRRSVHATTPSTALTNPHRVYILPTRAGLGYALILLAMLLGSLNYQNNLALFLTFVMASAAVVSMHHCWFHLLRLRLSARDGAAVFRGQTAHFPVTIEETGGRARTGLRIGDNRIELIASGHAQVQVPRPATRRGELPLGDVAIATRYPFGLFRAWTRVPLGASVLVYPTPASRAPVPGRVDVAAPRGNGDFGASERARSRGQAIRRRSGRARLDRLASDRRRRRRNPTRPLGSADPGRARPGPELWLAVARRGHRARPGRATQASLPGGTGEILRA